MINIQFFMFVPAEYYDYNPTQKWQRTQHWVVMAVPIFKTNIKLRGEGVGKGGGAGRRKKLNSGIWKRINQNLCLSE